MECLKHTDHRPYPLPSKPPIGRQRWLDLAFFHWRAPADLVQKHLPRGIELDLYEGEAWLSVVPFRMEDVMLRDLPAIPGVSNFPELNLRTYVIKDGRAGVWFFSLDADQRLAVMAARTFFHLPYFKASMQCSEGENGTIRYSSQRAYDGAQFVAEYTPTGEVYSATKGSLEYWLTERYCLYAADASGGLYRGEVHHKPWPLQKVEANISLNQIGDKEGFDFSGEPAFAQFSKTIDVAFWPLQKC